MDIQLLEWKAMPSRRSIGRLVVKYGALKMRLEVMSYKDEHLWVKMPERPVNGDRNLKLCFWEEKEVSDAFQQEVLRQLHQLYGKEVEIAWKLVKAASRKQESEISGQD